MAEATGTAVAVQNSKPVALISDTFVPHNLVELKELASFLAASDLIPKSLNGRKENVAIVLMMGHEIGIPGVAALSNIYVVNGRPTIWGDLATALVRRSGLCEKLSLTWEGSGPTLKAIAKGKRKGDPEEAMFTFSWDDAKLAGHAGKDTYIKNPKDMLGWRASHRLYKFLWADVLKGLDIREIVQDEAIETTAEAVVVEQPEQLPAVHKAEPAKPSPEPEQDVPGPTAEELEEIRQKKAVEYAKANAVDKPKEAPAEEKPSASGLAGEPTPSKPMVLQVFGTVVKCVKKGEGYAVILTTKEGEQKFTITYDAACDIKTRYEKKTMGVKFEALVPAVAGIVGRCLEYGDKKVDWEEAV